MSRRGISGFGLAGLERLGSDSQPGKNTEKRQHRYGGRCKRPVMMSPVSDMDLRCLWDVRVGGGNKESGP